MSSNFKNFFTWVSHPEELVCSILYLLKHSTPDETNIKMKSSGELKKCYQFLESTSRSFATVIQEIHPKLRNAICIYYLVLRGLDTIEDDMGININYKRSLLLDFHTHLYEIGWSFEESSPEEKDAPLLMEFHVVIEEFLKLDRAYQDTISDITKQMGEGMAKYLDKRINTVEDWNEYCHYVAGLVGIGLSKLFYYSGLEDKSFLDSEKISNSMGLYLQKANIIRDVNEDLLDDRRFWPTEIWSKHVNYIRDIILSKQSDKSVHCLNEMCLNTFDHVPDVIEYLSMIRDPSVFNFCAIPQTMAIATISACLNNELVLKENVKIRKGEAIRIMYEANNFNNCLKIFVRYLDTMKAKISKSPEDPSYKLLINKISTLRTNIGARVKYGLFDYIPRSYVAGFIIFLILYLIKSFMFFVIAAHHA
ncbi:Squalene synthase [Smittium mucronatum]|uniref:Squalene synthase n=1 Tax=Smittium mucronatum TaxID=133383 RepID=A0A1R0GX37_9FUNG|nr:Squalene synthase [Smittium mucronatum]